MTFLSAVEDADLNELYICAVSSGMSLGELAHPKDPVMCFASTVRLTMPSPFDILQHDVLR